MVNYYEILIMKKSTSKSFTFLYPTTYEENQEQLARLDSEILEASKKRNYALAKKLQKEYNYCTQVDNYFKEQKLLKEKNSEANRLKNAKMREEELLKQRMTSKMKNTLSQYEQRLQALEKKHQDNLSQIETRYSSPRIAAYRPSANLRQLLKTESFYANQRDFESAEQYRNIIARKAQQEIIELETNNEQSFSAAVEAENRRYEIEKRGFHARLENEKVKLKTETERELLQINHKYSYLTLKNAELSKKKPSNSPPKSNKPNTSLNATTTPKFTINNSFSTCVIFDANNDSNANTYNPNTTNTSKTSKNDKSFFITNNNQQVGGEENVYKALNDGFSDILQRTEVRNKDDFGFPVTEPKPQLTLRNSMSIRKPNSRSPRTARTRRRPATDMMFSSTY